MTALFIVNNYQLGAKVKSTPTHKIIEQTRIDAAHTAIKYADISARELAFIERVLSKKPASIEE